MASVAANTDFTVWGIDQTAYGPVELPTLVSWVKDERVTAETWIFAGRTGSWQKAVEVPELQMFFRPKATAPAINGAVGRIDARALRRVKILAGKADTIGSASLLAAASAIRALPDSKPPRGW